MSKNGKNQKRLILVATIVLVLAMGLTACGKKSSDEDNKSTA